MEGYVNLANSLPNSIPGMLNVPNSGQKDARWLQLEVCREFLRRKCQRSSTDCKFAHPASNVEIVNGLVTACYDSIKGRCKRDKPPCKFYHPPQHLKDQLLINGRNNLAFKNAVMGNLPSVAAVANCGIPYINQSSQSQTMNSYFANSGFQFPHPAAGLYVPSAAAAYLSPPSGCSNEAVAAAASQVFQILHPFSTADSITIPASAAVLFQQQSAAAAAAVAALAAAQSKTSAASVTNSTTGGGSTRTDRIEVCREYLRGACKRSIDECRFAHPTTDHVVCSDDGFVTICMDYEKGRCVRDPCRYFHRQRPRSERTQNSSRNSAIFQQTPTPPPVTLGAGVEHNPTCDPNRTSTSNQAPVMIPYKRSATTDQKSGLPVYHPPLTTATENIVVTSGEVQSSSPSISNNTAVIMSATAYHNALLHQIQQQHQQQQQNFAAEIAYAGQTLPISFIPRYQ